MLSREIPVSSPRGLITKSKNQHTLFSVCDFGAGDPIWDLTDGVQNSTTDPCPSPHFHTEINIGRNVARAAEEPCL